MNALVLSLITLFSTSAGGLCALKLRNSVQWVLTFTAGVLLGVVCFDLLPKSIELSRQLGNDQHAPIAALTGGFLLFHGLEKLLLVSTSRTRGPEHARSGHRAVGVTSAAALIGHSFVDGVGIGLAFQISPAVGLTVAAAVIAHDFCDGLNTVSLMLVHGNPTTRALKMLALDAAAPVLGVATTMTFSVPREALVLYLGFFAGFLVYIGASHILPRAHWRSGSVVALGSIGMTVLGGSFIYTALRLTG